MAVLQTACGYAMTCTDAAERGCFGTHSAHAEPDGFAVIAGYEQYDVRLWRLGSSR